MEEISISVVMPVYNGEKYLKESIESILQQTFNEFEFIIVNDGSTDKTGEIIREYIKKDERIILVERNNRGLVESLNQGIKISNGKYIARMDADDISHKNRLYRQFKYLESHKDIDILGTYINVIGNSNNCVSTKKWFNNTWTKREMERKIMEDTIIAHPTVMMKKDVLLKLGGYSNKYSRMEDYDLWAKAIKSGFKIDNLDEILLTYRIHDDSKSKREIKDEYNYRKEKIKLKLEHFYNKRENEANDIFVWGCGEASKLIYECLLESDIKINGFIDTYKTGSFMEKNIYNSDVLKTQSNKFVFIATQVGFRDVERFLLSINQENYLYLL